jgi:tetratricopeptide (TPR) repeat protein
MRRIREVFAAARLELQHEDTERVVDLGAVREPGHYWGWYAAAPAWSGPVRFRAGAVGVHLDPLAAREVRSAARGWVGPLVEAGVTATAGTVYEPTDAGLPDGALFFERFLAGASFAEAMTSASRFTSWTALFVGDPLYAPYAAGAAHRQEANRARVTAGPAELEAALDAGRAPEAAGWRELAELLEPEHPLAFLVREARAREDGGKAAGSVAQLREALRRGEPERALRISPANFEANLQTGRAQLEARQTAAAIRSLERARGVEPNSAEARMLLARAYLAGRRAEEAQAEAEAAFGLSVSTAAQRLLAEVLAARGNHAEACVHLRRVHRADPGRAGPAVELARSCLKIGRAAEAVDALEASMGDLPEDAEGGRRMLEQARLLEEAARDAKDEKRHRATQEIVRQWRLGEAPPRDLEAVGRALEELARSEPRALDPLRESAEPVEGVPRVWVGSRHIEPVEILVVGPSARRARLEPLGATGKEAVMEWRLLPGIYRVAVVVGKGSARRIFVRRQRIEAGRGYGLAVDENDRLYLPAPPR